MAAGNWILYTKFKEYMADGTIDLDTHTFKVHLVNGYTPALTHQLLATAAIATAPSSNGGATDFTLTGVTWAATGTSMKFDSSATATWTATGGTLNATHAIIFDDTSTGVADALVGYCDLNTSTTGPVAVTAGNTLSISFAANGIFQLSGATS
jgi:hypothetical protein